MDKDEGWLGPEWQHRWRDLDGLGREFYRSIKETSDICGGEDEGSVEDGASIILGSYREKL